MGTQKQIKEEQLHRQFKRSLLFTLPLVLLGALGLGYMVFVISGNRDIDSLDFTVGSLWENKNRSPEAVLDISDVVVPEFNLFNHPGDLDFVKAEQRMDVITSDQKIKSSVQSIETVLEEAYRPTTSSYEQVNLQKKELAEIYKLHTLSKAPMARLELTSLISDVTVKPGTKWALGLKFAPGFSYRLYEHQGHGAATRVEDGTRYYLGESQEFRNNNDKVGSCLTAGLDIRRVFKKWALETGLYYSTFSDIVYVEEFSSNKENHKIVNSLSPGETIYTTTSNQAIDEGIATPFSNTWAFLEIPIKVIRKFQWSNNRSIEPAIGASLAYMVQTDIVMFDFDKNVYYWVNSPDHSDINRLHYFVSGGTYISQFISPNTQLYVNPEFKMDLSSAFNDDHSVKQLNYQFNLGLGCKVFF